MQIDVKTWCSVVTRRSWGLVKRGVGNVRLYQFNSVIFCSAFTCGG